MSRYRQTMAEALKQVNEANQKPYVSMSSGGQYNVLDKDGKTAYSTRDKTLAYDYFKKNYDNLKEATHGWTIVSKAKDIAKKFKDNMTKAVAEIEKLEKGLSKNPTVDAELRKYNENLEEIEVDESKISDIFKSNKEGESVDDIAKRLNLSTAMVKKLLGEENDKENQEPKKEEDNKEDEIQSLKAQITLLKQKLENEKHKAVKPEPNPQTGEVPLTIGVAAAEFKKEKEKKEVQKEEVSDKLKLSDLKKKIKQYKDKVFSKTMSTIKSPLFADKDTNEACWDSHKQVGMKTKGGKQVPNCVPKESAKEENLQELPKSERDKRIQKAKDMIKYYDAQKKAALKGKNKDLAKKMLKNDIEETVSIKAYKNAVDPSKKGLMISKSGGMSGTIMIKDKKELQDLETKLAQAKRMYNIKEMNKDSSAYAIGMSQAMKSTGDKPPLEKKTIEKGHEIAKSILKKEETLDEFTSNMIKRLQISYADLKGKTLSPEKATALSKHLDRLDLASLKQLVKANIPFVTGLARNKVYKKTGKFEEKRMYVESMAGLKKKSEKSGMSYSILKKVYDRGMAAWKSGHRPGASQQQWAYARVNSFITKSSGTWGGADKDLAKQVKG